MNDLSQCKPCPFCGNTHPEEFAIHAEQLRHEWSTGFHYNYNVCCSCGSTGPDGSTKEASIEMWNKRESGNMDILSRLSRVYDDLMLMKETHAANIVRGVALRIYVQSEALKSVKETRKVWR